jgi:hypothetical protein
VILLIALVVAFNFGVRMNESKTPANLGPGHTIIPNRTENDIDEVTVSEDGDDISQ